jgi:hypothetical protein
MSHLLAPKKCKPATTAAHFSSDATIPIMSAAAALPTMAVFHEIHGWPARLVQAMGTGRSTLSNEKAAMGLDLRLPAAGLDREYGSDTGPIRQIVKDALRLLTSAFPQRHQSAAYSTAGNPCIRWRDV